MVSVVRHHDAREQDGHDTCGQEQQHTLQGFTAETHLLTGQNLLLQQFKCFNRSNSVRIHFVNSPESEIPSARP